MKLTREAGDILCKASIGMLALRSGRLPLVNPAVFTITLASNSSRAMQRRYSGGDLA